jgi:hypothetical protein
VKPQVIGLRCHDDFAAACRTVQGMSREVFHHWVCWRGWWMQLGNMGRSFGGGLVVERGKGNATMDALWWELQGGSELSRDRAVAAGWAGVGDVTDSFAAKAPDRVSALGHTVVGGEAPETASHEPFYEGLSGHACSGTRLVQHG